MDIKKYICPVRTGMNPSPTVLRSYCKNMPRMHGDEPMKLEAMKHQRESAPYTRDSLKTMEHYLTAGPCSKGPVFSSAKYFLPRPRQSHTEYVTKTKGIEGGR